MTRDYPRIATIEEFGHQLFTSGDLDPLYIALHKAAFNRNHLKRWLLAYWCCYHAGASSVISESPHYWATLETMAGNIALTPIGTRWPRGHERRHFRGDKAIHAVRYMQQFIERPEGHVEWLESAAPNFGEIRARVLELPQFGPWIAFKVADMIDRVLRTHVDFTNSDVFMFEQPASSALEVWKSRNNGQPPSPDAIPSITRTLVEYFQQYQAPPLYDRPANIQEVETILCKWKSHNNGSYPMGIDSHELREGLKQWSSASPTAARLLDVAP